MVDHYGPTHWWPGDSPFEVAVGAILVQNTAWTNVERAIENLKRDDLLDPHRMLAVSEETLADAIRPSGYFRVKTKRLRSFCAYLVERYDGNMALMSRMPLAELRDELLAVHGIGPETADDILLYACDKPIFVVDAYTRRVACRHGLISPKPSYDGLQEFFHDGIGRDLSVYKEFHALIVYVGKDFCRPTPRCAECPLAPLLPGDGAIPD